MAICAISGSGGFIGHHLTKRLIDDGHYVYALDRMILQDPVGLKETLVDLRPDYIFHLASYGNHFYQTDEYQTVLINVFLLLNLLEATKDIPYKGFMNFSTTYHNLESRSFYGSSKASGEYIARSYVQKYNKNIVNIRPYSVYGEYEWEFRFIPTICRQIAAKQEITVSDVSHDWIYIEDFIDGLLKASEHAKKLKGKSVGIGTGTRITNKEIAQKIMAIAGNRVRIINGTKREYEIPAYSKDMQSKTYAEKNEIEYFQYGKTPLEEGLKRVYESSHLWLKRQA